MSLSLTALIWCSTMQSVGGDTLGVSYVTRVSSDVTSSKHTYTIMHVAILGQTRLRLQVPSKRFAWQAVIEG